MVRTEYISGESNAKNGLFSRYNLIFIDYSHSVTERQQPALETNFR